MGGQRREGVLMFSVFVFVELGDWVSENYLGECTLKVTRPNGKRTKI